MSAPVMPANFTGHPEGNRRELYHFGRKLTSEPRNVSLHDLAAALRGSESPTYVCLEPGDGTRYDLVIVRFGSVRDGGAVFRCGVLDYDNESLLITRLFGDYEAASAVMTVETEDHALRPLCNQNAWTHRVLAWWLADLWEALEDVR